MKGRQSKMTKRWDRERQINKWINRQTDQINWFLLLFFKKFSCLHGIMQSWNSTDEEQIFTNALVTKKQLPKFKNHTNRGKTFPKFGKSIYLRFKATEKSSVMYEPHTIGEYKHE